MAAQHAGRSAVGDAGQGGAGGQGSGVEYTEVHGCNPDTAVDETGNNVVVVEFGYTADEEFVYTPKCVTVSKGTTLVMSSFDGSDFLIHPLRGGEQPNGSDDNSPFGFQNAGGVTALQFEMDELGTFPYYCVAHVSVAMWGAVYVK